MDCKPSKSQEKKKEKKPEIVPNRKKTTVWEALPY
jgi:hypothetical protein